MDSKKPLVHEAFVSSPSEVFYYCCQQFFGFNFSCWPLFTYNSARMNKKKVRCWTWYKLQSLSFQSDNVLSVLKYVLTERSKRAAVLVTLIRNVLCQTVFSGMVSWSAAQHFPLQLHKTLSHPTVFPSQSQVLSVRCLALQVMYLILKIFSCNWTVEAF